MTTAPPRWRVGRKVPVNLYKDGQIGGQHQSPELAAELVEAANAAPKLYEALEAFITEEPRPIQDRARFERGRAALARGEKPSGSDLQEKETDDY